MPLARQAANAFANKAKHFGNAANLNELRFVGKPQPQQNQGGDENVRPEKIVDRADKFSKDMRKLI